MTFGLHAEPSGRYICHISDEVEATTVTASNVPDAGDDLLAAVDEAGRSGFGECFWAEPGGEYRWMFRREEDAVTVVVLWSSGTVMGWQHVFRSRCPFGELQEVVGRELARLRLIQFLD
jgi:hypothetical protein